MYRIVLQIFNPQTGASKQIVRQFDPDSMTQAKWSAAFPSVQTEINNLKTESTPNEPPTW